MSFAPILNPAAYKGKHASHVRRAAVAASRGLQALAQDDGAGLAKALAMLPEPAGRGSADPWLDEGGADLYKKLLTDFPSVAEAMKASGLEQAEFGRHLLAQLRQVQAFGNLDRQEGYDFVRPVSELIRSGRVELFAGYVTDFIRKASFNHDEARTSFAHGEAQATGDRDLLKRSATGAQVAASMLL
jgi:hypothetical protein